MTVGAIHREFGLMVDYFALISPTIEPLANASYEERKVVYDRLITMLDQQLRAAEPPRSDKDILKERINLEAAIRRVERRILSSQRTNADKKSAITTEITQKNSIEPPVNGAPAPEQEVVLPPAERAVDVLRPDPEPSFRQEIRQDEVNEPVPEPLSPETLEPEQLEPEQLEPEPQYLVAIETKPEVSDAEPALAAIRNVEGTEAIVSSDDPMILSAVPDQIETFEASHVTTSPDHLQDQTSEFSVDGALAELAEETTDKLDYYNLPSVDPTPRIEEGTEQEWVTPEKIPDLRPGLPSGGGIRPIGAGPGQQTKGLWLRIGIIALVIMALAASIGGISEFLAQQSAERKAERGQAPVQEEAATEQKLADRLPLAADETPKSAVTQNGGKGTVATEPNDADILIQRAILLEEPPGGLGDPKRTMGRVNWKLETLRSTLTNTSDIGAKATIELAEAGLSANFVFRRNRDQTSANTHLIEISVTPSPDNPNGKIREVSVPELRVDEKTRGANLEGIAVPVADNVFLIGLSGLPKDILRNIDLLRTRNWFLVPMRYSNGKRALLMFEKGKPGERVFEDAMQTWQ